MASPEGRTFGVPRGPLCFNWRLRCIRLCAICTLSGHNWTSSHFFQCPLRQMSGVALHDARCKENGQTALLQWRISALSLRIHPMFHSNHGSFFDLLQPVSSLLRWFEGEEPLCRSSEWFSLFELAVGGAIRLSCGSLFRQFSSASASHHVRWKVVLCLS